MFDDQNRRHLLEVVVLVAISKFIQCCISRGFFGDYHIVRSLVPYSGGKAKELPRGVPAIVRAQLVPNREFFDGAGCRCEGSGGVIEYRNR
jgi:hypothetical protein